MQVKNIIAINKSREMKIKAQEQERRLATEANDRIAAFKKFHAAITRYRLFILGSYPIYGEEVHLSPERVAIFDEIRQECEVFLGLMREYGIIVPDNVKKVINEPELREFTRYQDCQNYFEKLDRALHGIVMYY